jgi:hypothetical protein
MFWIMPEGNRKPDPNEPDPAALAKLLELELIQKRAAWQRSRSNLRSLRVLSFFFLFLVILGALLAFFFLFSPDRVQEMKSEQPSSAAPTP